MIVRKLRLQRGWTQEHLAELTGLSVRSIQRIERGQSCSLETANALAAVFGVDRSTFQSGETPMLKDSPVLTDETEAIEYVKGLKEFYGHVLMYVFFVVIFGLVFGFRQPLIYWGAIGWGIGLIVHALNVFEIINVLGPAWEKKQIEKRLGRSL